MGASILGIGQSALSAAQLGIATTGHNIANANTPGYSRQILLQSAAPAQSDGGSFIGQGTKVGETRRIYNQFIGQQLNSTQSSQNYAAAYLAQIQTINGLVSDPTGGVSPSLQEFFGSIQNLTANPNGATGLAARQSVLSTATTLTSRLQSLGSRLGELSEEVNSRISATVGNINGFAKEISNLNDAIETAESVSGGAIPNDLLDQRDYAITQLSKLIDVSVVEQSGKYNVFMGTGQPLILGSKVSILQPTSSVTDSSRLTVSYENKGQLIPLNEKSLTGGELGGIFAFRNDALDISKNSLGRVAVSIATEFNDQHKLGQDLNGTAGTDFFTIAQPVSTNSSTNSSLSTASISATFADVSALTTSDYRVQYLEVALPAVGNEFKITRISDGTAKTFTTLPATVDGIKFSLALNNAVPPVAGTPVVGDEFLVRPTAAAAMTIGLAIKDITKLAVATPLTTSVPSTNLGTGKITSSVVNSLASGSSNSLSATIGAVSTDDSYNPTTLTSPLTLTQAPVVVVALPAPPHNEYSLSGFPSGALVSVKNAGVSSSYEVVTAPALANPLTSPPQVLTVPYTSGATISYAGLNFALTNAVAATYPSAGEQFTLSSTLPVASTTLTYNTAGNNFTGFPANANVTVKNGNSTTSYLAGSAIPYVEGSTVSFDGLSFVVAGAFKNGDVVNISNNLTGSGDNRNALLLAGLQTKNLLASGTTSFQGAYSQFVSLVGNKTHELQATNLAETRLLASAVASQQSESGVNLDEEAANLLRYQQAYQAAGKLMQIASQLFDALLQLGR